MKKTMLFEAVRRTAGMLVAALAFALVLMGCPTPVDGEPTPVLSGGTKSELITAQGNTATLKFTSDEAGTYYYLVLDSGDAAPDAAAVKGQKEYTATGTGTVIYPVKQGTGTAKVGENTISLTGLTAGDEYTAYVVVTHAKGSTSAVLTIAGVKPQVTPTAPAVHTVGLYEGSETSAKGDTATLTKAFAWLKDNAEDGKAYTIALGASASDNLAATALTNSEALHKATGVTIILESVGAEHTIQLTGTGSLFTIADGFTLVLNNNITLKGVGGNTAALVTVSEGANLVMWNGAKITGNTSSGKWGGGVYNAGTFTMYGGEISGNSATSTNDGTGSYGGGVYNNGGTFIKYVGIISGNTAGHGNAVYPE
jgi:hypothetical protein